MNVYLHIERLILEGIDLPHRRRPDLQAAVTSELSRLLAEQGLEANFRTGGAVPGLPAQTISFTNHNPAGLGRQIARAVYGGFN
jgi:hypothetical protein